MTPLVIVVLSTMAIATVMTIIHALIRKLVVVERLQRHNDVTAAVYATFGVLYAIILGLLVGHGQTRRDIVAEAAVHESALLVDVAQAGRAFDRTISDSLTRTCLRYAEHVYDVEWHMRKEERESPKRRQHINAIWDITRVIEPVGSRQESSYFILLEMMESLSSARHIRLAAEGDHMSPFLELVLIIGACITVVFLWLFGMEHHRVHLGYTWLVTFIVVLVLVLIFALDDPMRAGIGVRPEPYAKAAEELRMLLSLPHP